MKLSDFITLLGAEDVARAGSTIWYATESMGRLVSQLEATFDRQRFFMDDWLIRFEEVLKKDDNV